MVLPMVNTACCQSARKRCVALVDFCFRNVSSFLLFQPLCYQASFLRQLGGRPSLCDNWVPMDNSSLAGASSTSTMQSGAQTQKPPKMCPFEPAWWKFGDWWENGVLRAKNKTLGFIQNLWTTLYILWHAYGWKGFQDPFAGFKIFFPKCAYA